MTIPIARSILLAEEIIKHHPWASMVKFTRGGGEANALAIRLQEQIQKKCCILWLSWMARLVFVRKH